MPKTKKQNLNLYALLQLFEMVGFLGRENVILCMLQVMKESNFGGYLQRLCQGKKLWILSNGQGILICFKRFRIISVSQGVGVPSQTFCTFDFYNFDHYHKVGGMQVPIMGFDHMAFIGNKNYWPILKNIYKLPY